MDLKEEAILGEAFHKHWCYRAKAEALSAWMPEPGGHKALDAGAGSGFFSRLAGRSVFCVCHRY